MKDSQTIFRYRIRLLDDNLEDAWHLMPNHTGIKAKTLNSFQMFIIQTYQSKKLEGYFRVAVWFTQQFTAKSEYTSES